MHGWRNHSEEWGNFNSLSAAMQKSLDDWKAVIKFKSHCQKFIFLNSCQSLDPVRRPLYKDTKPEDSVSATVSVCSRWMVGEHLVICVRCALYIETISVDVHLRFQIKTETDPVSEHLFFFNLCIFKQWMINEVQNWTIPNATHHRHNPNRYDGLHVVHLLESNANLVCTQIYLHHTILTFFSFHFTKYLSISFHRSHSFALSSSSYSLFATQLTDLSGLSTFYPEDGDRNFLRNFSTYLTKYIASGNQYLINTRSWYFICEGESS